MHNLPLKKHLLCVALLGSSAVSLLAQAYTVPAGYFMVNITAGTVSSPAVSVISFPLQGTPAQSGVNAVAGQMVGVVSSVTSNTITNSNAGWTPAQLSSSATPTPYLVEFTSGAAAGRTFLISTSVANSGTTLTLDSTETTDLTTLGIVGGTDTYQILPADTLNSIFSANAPNSTGVEADGVTGTVLGGTSSTQSQADQVQLFNPQTKSWLTYYYDLNTSQWEKVGLIPAQGGSTIIRPDQALIYVRRAPLFGLMVMGRVATISRATSVVNSGITFLANNWPTDFTLINSNIQNIPNWTSADNVQVYLTSTKSWVTYFFNGTDWVKTGLIPASGDTTDIGAGSGLVLIKAGSATGQSVFTQSLPYNPYLPAQP